MRFPIALAALALAGAARADGPGRIASEYSGNDFALTADPGAGPWKGIRGVFVENGPMGQPVAGHRTEIRSRWTGRNLYLLFICPYEKLHLHPNPSTTEETFRLWDWDVAEAFIGTDFEHIRRYKEFEISPQGEWVDLDIDRDHMDAEKSWRWNSGFEAKARIDAERRIWYGEMRIPLAALDVPSPHKGLEMRANFYRCQGAPPDRKFLAWQPTGQRSFHAPESFGRLVLE